MPLNKTVDLALQRRLLHDRFRWWYSVCRGPPTSARRRLFRHSNSSRARYRNAAGENSGEDHDVAARVLLPALKDRGVLEEGAVAI